MVLFVTCEDCCCLTIARLIKVAGACTTRSKGKGEVYLKLPANAGERRLPSPWASLRLPRYSTTPRPLAHLDNAQPLRLFTQAT